VTIELKGAPSGAAVAQFRSVTWTNQVPTWPFEDAEFFD
jgi:hypothetical protein